jgi:hypothetical protein
MGLAIKTKSDSLILKPKPVKKILVSQPKPDTDKLIAMKNKEYCHILTSLIEKITNDTTERG